MFDEEYMDYLMEYQEFLAQLSPIDGFAKERYDKIVREFYEALESDMDATDDFKVR